MKTKTWTSADGTKEEVEVGSNKEKELLQKLHDAGLTTDDVGITIDEYLQTHERDAVTNKWKKK